MERVFEFLSDLLLAIYKALVDAIFSIWPSTPDSLKLGTILSSFPSDSFAYFAIIEVSYSVAGVVALVAIYKIIKILPLT